MMISEFRELTDKIVTVEEYEIIEMVYMYHPAIPDKKAIANIFNLPCGFIIIKDMLPRALKVKDVEDEIANLLLQVERARGRRSEITAE